MLAETFVDGSRFAVYYLVASWSKLGRSLGYGRAGWYCFFHGQPNTIWVCPIHLKARQWAGLAIASEPAGGCWRQWR